MQANAAPAGAAPRDPAFDEIKAFLVDATGNFRLSADDSPVLDKVRHRLRRNGLPSLSAYMALLKEGELGRRELDSLIAELTVGETFFFRHSDHFDALRDHVLPACLARTARSRQLRIWSAGCANGAETYSIAIVVHALLGERLAEWNVSIVGSDINRAFLAEAEAGTYSDWALRGVPPEKVRGLFVRRGAQWAVCEQYKDNVRFVYHNLINDEIPSIHKNVFAFDIIFCRNVMIYFDRALNSLLARRLNEVLIEDGWLFVGSTDFNPHLDALFDQQKHSGAILYRKRREVVKPASDPPSAVVRARPAESRRRDEQTAVAPEPVQAARQRRSVGNDRAVQPRSAPHQADPTDIATIVELANRGDWDNAARHCRAIVAADAFNAPAYYYLALILQSTGATAEAERALRRAIYLDRGFALAHYHLGLARKAARDRAGSRKAFRNAAEVLRQTPDDQPVSPCGLITAFNLRELASQQLELWGDKP